MSWDHFENSIRLLNYTGKDGDGDGDGVRVPLLARDQNQHPCIPGKPCGPGHQQAAMRCHSVDIRVAVAVGRRDVAVGKESRMFIGSWCWEAGLWCFLE